MPNKHYYLVASLPRLDIDKDTPITADAFMLECEKWLSAKELNMLKGAGINTTKAGDEGRSISDIWADFNFTLKHRLADIRREKAHAHFAKGEEPLREIFQQQNPLLMERRLERLRWDFLESYESDYNFDINSLIIYFLKLQICIRLDAFDKEKGAARFKKLCEVNF